jgi:hypothetical protein
MALGMLMWGEWIICMLLCVKLGERGGWRGIMMKCNDVIATGNPPGFSQTFPDPEDRCGVTY